MAIWPAQAKTTGVDGQARKTQIVVIGGGAGGLELVRRLGARYGRKRHDIILVERNRTHVWKPLLHEVAAGSLDANLDEVGYRSHCHRWGYRYFYGTFEGLDREAREVILAPLMDDDGSELIARHRIRYDYLVIAVGSVTNDFGIPGVAENCMVLDDRAGADRFRNRLLNHCLRVSQAMTARRDADEHVRIAIVGGGATGVELAAEMYNAAAALRHYGLEVFDESRLEITLIEAGPRILPALPERIAGSATRLLQGLGVRVRTGARVTEVAADGVQLADGERIPTDLVVWAAGVKAPAFLRDLAGLETNRLNQLVVGPTLQTTRDDAVFALGDCAAAPWLGREGTVPPRAQAAHQQASHLVKQMQRRLRGQPLQPWRYRDFGSLVSLGEYTTVGNLMGSLVGGNLWVDGLFARAMYLSLYPMHEVAVHGWWKTALGSASRMITRSTEPRVKLH